MQFLVCTIMRAPSSPRICQAAAAIGLICLAGCSATYGSRQSYRLIEPVNPGWGGAAPLGAQPGRAQRPITRPLQSPQNNESQTNPLERQSIPPGDSTDSHDLVGDLDPPPEVEREGAEELSRNPERSAGGKLTVPSIEADEVLAVGKLELQVEAAERSPVGRLVRFQVTARNSSAAAIEQVNVVCELPPSLRFPGSETAELTASTPRLDAGESKQWELSLEATEAGSHCCHFRLYQGQHTQSEPVAEKKVCIEFVDQQFSLEVIGPERRVEGGRAEFIIVVGNPSNARRERVRVAVTFDQALVLRESTEDVEVTTGSPGELTWKLEGLDPGESRQIQAEFECHRAARRACVSVEVSAVGMPPERDEVCLEIAAPTGALDVQLSDRLEPMRVGHRGQYDLSVRNIGIDDVRDVGIELQIPAELEVLSARLAIRGEALDVQYSVRDGRLTFDPIDRLFRNQTITGVIEVEGKRAGRVEIRASVTTPLDNRATSTAEPTLIEAESSR